MKTHPITIGLMILTVSLLVSCKNNETPAPETPVTTEVAPTTPVDTTANTTKTVMPNNSPMSKPTGEKEEDEKNEK